MRQQPSERQAANDAAADTDHKGACFYIKTTKLPDHPVHFCRTIREFIFISSNNCYGTMRRKTGIFRRSMVVSIDSASASTVAEMT